MRASPPAWIPGLALLALLSGATPTLAFDGHEHQRFDIDLPEPTNNVDKPSAIVLHELNHAPAWRQWQRSFPGWQARWDGGSRTVHRAWGPGVRLQHSPTQSSIERDSRELLERTAAWSGVDATQLRLVQARRELDRWYVVFEQVVDNLPIYGGRVDLRISGDGQLMLLGADWISARTGSTLRSLASDATLRAAQQGFARPALQAESQRSVLVPLPAPQASTAAPTMELRLADELIFRTVDPRGLWHCLVDVQTGRILERHNQHRPVDVVGNIGAQVHPGTPFDTEQRFPLQDTRLNIGSGLTEFGNSDANGDFSVPSSSPDSVNVFVQLSGPFARIYNDELARVTPRIDSKALPGSPIVFTWDDSNSRASERDAYAHALIAHDYIKALDPSFTGVDYVMPVVVDIGGNACNAWWDGWGINFLLAGSGCVNTAQIADVVYHEYGHGITDWQYRPFAPSGAMHEGFSDYMAATMRNDPKVGNGWRGDGTFLRTVDNNMRTPDHLTGEVHNDGLIIAAALWDLRMLLGAARTDTLFHYARYGLTDNFDDYMLDVLVTDDDNGNIYDGTPSFDFIIAAFATHGIGDFRVQIGHDGLLDTEDIAKTLVVSSQILSLFPLQSASLTLHYRVNDGAWSTIPLQEVAGVRQFEAQLPAQADETTIDYWLEAIDTQNNIGRWPSAAPAVVHRFKIGTDTTPPVVSSMPLVDRPVDSPGGWSVRAQVEDNLDHGIAGVDLLWSLNNPSLGNSTAMVAIDATTWNGVVPTGALLGDTIHYALVATDSATTPNSTQVPDSGTWSFQIVQGSFRDFEANDGSLSPAGEWQWGVPTLGPDAWSGSNVWATNLASGYFNDVQDDLEWTPVDLSTWQAAALRLQHWHAIEDFWDGGRVEISTDNGATWQVLVPDGGYPWTYIDALGGAGFSGESNGWQQAEFDLSRYLGMSVRIRLHFESDSGVTDLGWYVDDVELVERQILAVPLQLDSRDGGDGEVPLRWSPPAGIDPQQPGTPLLGYNVYRSDTPDLDNATLLNGSPVADAEYVDTTVANGTTYYYAVSALFANGESPRGNIVAALPYRAVYNNAVEQFIVEAAAGAGVDTALTFDNDGSGFLFLNAWVGDEHQAIDDVRIAWNVPPVASKTSARVVPSGLAKGSHSAPAERRDRAYATSKVGADAVVTPAQLGTSSAVPDFMVVFVDPLDSTGPADLNEFAVADENGQIFFRVTGHSNWGNILTDFTIIISIDSDGNRSTGDAAGSDHHILVGAFPMQAVGIAAIISNNDQELLGIPSHIVVPANTDYMEVGFNASILGEMSQVFLRASALSADLSVFHDAMPNAAAASAWLNLTDPFLSVEAGAPQALRFTLAAGLTADAYDANLLLDTNDPSQATASVALQFRSGVTPVAVHDFVATQERNAVSLSWRTSLETNVRAYRVFRAGPEGNFEALQPDVPLSPSRSYFFRDRNVETGEYTYRIGEVAPSGEITLHGRLRVSVATTTPKQAFLDPNVPNPFNPNTTIAYGVDRDGPVQLDIFDSRGRLVRALIRQPRTAAGYHQIIWDGRDQRGRACATGIYYARLVVNGRHLSQRMTLLK